MLYAVGTVLITVENTLLLVLIVHRFRAGAGLLGVTDALAGIGMLVAATLYKKIKERADYRYLHHGRLRELRGADRAAAHRGLDAAALHPAVRGVLRAGPGARPDRDHAQRGPGRVGRTFGAANACGLGASVVATVAVSAIVGRHGVVPGFLTLALIGGVPALTIGVSLMTSRIWAPSLTSSPTS